MWKKWAEPHPAALGFIGMPSVNHVSAVLVLTLALLFFQGLSIPPPVMCHHAMRRISLQLPGPSPSGALSIPGWLWWSYTSPLTYSGGKLNISWLPADSVDLDSSNKQVKLIYVFLLIGPGLKVSCPTPSISAGWPTCCWTWHGCCCGTESMLAAYWHIIWRQTGTLQTMCYTWLKWPMSLILVI